MLDVLDDWLSATVSFLWAEPACLLFPTALPGPGAAGLTRHHLATRGTPTEIASKLNLEGCNFLTRSGEAPRPMRWGHRPVAALAPGKPGRFCAPGLQAEVGLWHCGAPRGRFLR